MKVRLRATFGANAIAHWNAYATDERKAVEIWSSATMADPERGVDEMRAAAQLADRRMLPAWQIVYSYATDEAITLEGARLMVDRLHRRLTDTPERLLWRATPHGDTDCRHVHELLLRSDPDTGNTLIGHARINDILASFSREMSAEHVRPRLFAIDSPIAGRARDAETFNGEVSFERFLRELFQDAESVAIADTRAAAFDVERVRSGRGYAYVERRNDYNGGRKPPAVRASRVLPAAIRQRELAPPQPQSRAHFPSYSARRGKESLVALSLPGGIETWRTWDARKRAGLPTWRLGEFARKRGPSTGFAQESAGYVGSVSERGARSGHQSRFPVASSSVGSERQSEMLSAEQLANKVSFFAGSLTDTEAAKRARALIDQLDAVHAKTTFKLPPDGMSITVLDSLERALKHVSRNTAVDINLGPATSQETKLSPERLAEIAAIVQAALTPSPNTRPSWQAVHDGLEAHGLRYKPTFVASEKGGQQNGRGGGTGAVIQEWRDGKFRTVAKGGDIGFTRPKLEKTLGAFVESQSELARDARRVEAERTESKHALAGLTLDELNAIADEQNSLTFVDAFVPPLQRPALEPVIADGVETLPTRDMARLESALSDIAAEIEAQSISSRANDFSAGSVPTTTPPKVTNTGGPTREEETLALQNLIQGPRYERAQSENVIGDPSAHVLTGRNHPLIVQLRSQYETFLETSDGHLSKHSRSLLSGLDSKAASTEKALATIRERTNGEPIVLRRQELRALQSLALAQEEVAIALVFESRAEHATSFAEFIERDADISETARREALDILAKDPILERRRARFSYDASLREMLDTTITEQDGITTYTDGADRTRFLEKEDRYYLRRVPAQSDIDVALRLAQARFGEVDLRGDDRFVTRAIERAAALGITISTPHLQTMYQEAVAKHVLDSRANESGHRLPDWANSAAEACSKRQGLIEQHDGIKHVHVPRIDDAALRTLIAASAFAPDIERRLILTEPEKLTDNALVSASLLGVIDLSQRSLAIAQRRDNEGEVTGDIDLIDVPAIDEIRKRDDFEREMTVTLMGGEAGPELLLGQLVPGERDLARTR